jgi:hypothetical protein
MFDIFEDQITKETCRKKDKKELHMRMKYFLSFAPSYFREIELNIT